VIDRREALLSEEEKGWRVLMDTLGPLDDEQFERPGLTDDGWSVKDLCWHIGAWCAYAFDALEQIASGTYRDEELDVEALNREWFELSRKVDSRTARAELAAARTRMCWQLQFLPEISSQAVEWFEESGHLHYREHVGDLTGWVEELRRGSG
jgi:mycothiol maleylpyruvate isomerase-like protein